MILSIRRDLEAQGYRSLSLPEEGKPFLDYPNETRRGAVGRLLVVGHHAALACLMTYSYRRVTTAAVTDPCNPDAKKGRGPMGDTAAALRMLDTFASVRRRILRRHQNRARMAGTQESEMGKDLPGRRSPAAACPPWCGRPRYESPASSPMAKQ